MKNKQNMATMLIPLALGFMTGAAVALLTTPMSGKEARQKIKRSKQHVTDSLDDNMDEARQRMEESLRHAQALRAQLAETIRFTKQSGEEKAANLKDELENRAKRLKNNEEV